MLCCVFYRGRLEMKNFIMPPVGHSITLTRLVTDPTSKDNPDKQAGVIGDDLREVSTENLREIRPAKQHPHSRQLQQTLMQAGRRSVTLR
jgi:hypothetical protein